MTRSSIFSAFSRVFVVAVLALAWPRTALAYPWMIRHEYTACAQCHVDPSGSGPLSAYGRAMGEVILRTHYGSHSAEEPDDPGKTGNFLWGAVPLPEWLDLGGSFRWMSLTRKIGDTRLDNRFIYMQSDLSATINAGRFVASGSVGYDPDGGLLSAITRGPDENVVSREHWIGYRLDEGQTLLLRAGRMNLPFGIRDVMHTLEVRSTTRTDVNDAQQHGLSLSYSGEGMRGEIMGILGNFQTRPDDYRERGYSAFFEWAPVTTAAVGVSSRIAHVALDPRELRPMWRHAHGVFGRWATPWKPLVLLGEGDFVVDSIKNRPRNQGFAGMLQADLEAIQGVHYQLTGEVWDFGPHRNGFSEALWASFLWFFAPHADVRLDGIYRSLWGAEPLGRSSEGLLLVQAHVYL